MWEEKYYLKAHPSNSCPAWSNDYNWHRRGHSSHMVSNVNEEIVKRGPEKQEGRDQRESHAFRRGFKWAWSVLIANSSIYGTFEFNHR